MQESLENKGFDADFDTFWKEMLDFIEPVTLFFLPQLHREVDWSQDYRALEQELRGLGAKGKMKRTDKLFRFKLRDGTERYVLFHIEVEAYPNSNFPRRIYEYHSFLNLKHQFIPITILVIFVGKKPSKAWDTYETNHFGTRTLLSYPTFCVDEQEETALINNPNPIALVVLANLYVIRSKEDIRLRTTLKRKLLSILLDRKIDRSEFKKLINFALNFIRLPEENDNEVSNFITDKIMKSDTPYFKVGNKKYIDYYAMIIDAVFKSRYGVPMEEYGRAMEEQKRTMNERTLKLDQLEQEMDMQLKTQKQIIEAAIEQQKQVAEQQKQAAEQQKQAAAQQKQAAEQQKQAAEQQRKNIIHAHLILLLDAKQISEHLEIDLKIVEETLATVE
jgi:hypothetical protein